MRIHRDERGQTIILVALSLPLLLGFVAIATDVGALFKDKRTMQTAADAAAIAAALNRNYDYQTAGKDASIANGYHDGNNGVTVTINNGPTWAHSNYKGVSGYYEAVVTKVEPTIFMSIFGYPHVTVTARAVAGLGAGTGCIYTLETTGNGFRVNGNVTVSLPGCGININADLLINGASGKLSASYIDVAGSTGGYGPPQVTPAPAHVAAPYSDPLSYLPQYSCTTSTTGHGSHQVTTGTCSCATGSDCSSSPIPNPGTCTTPSLTGTVNLSPSGCYLGLDFSGASTVNLSPGLYIVNGDVKFGNATINGSGVSFYYTGQLTMGSGQYTLSPPDSSQLFNGVLFAESIGDTNSITFGGNSNTVIKGIVYAPSANFSMAGTPNITLDAAFVVNQITLSGNPNFTNYASLPGSDSPLNSVVLVE